MEVSTVSVFTEAPTPAYANRRSKPSNRFNEANNKPTTSYNQANNDARRSSFKPKIQPSPLDHEHQTTSLYKFKLNRTPGRWQYKTTPKPRVTIRKTAENEVKEEVKQSFSVNEKPDDDQVEVDGDIDLSSSPSINGDILDREDTNGNHIDKPLPIETLKVEVRSRFKSRVVVSMVINTSF